MCIVVGRLEWSKDPESYAGGSVATGRASLAGQVKGDDPDWERHPSPPGWGLGLRLTTLSRKKSTVQKPVLKPRTDETIDDGHSRKRTNEIRTATWNIRTMYIAGRLQEIAEEVLKYKLDIYILLLTATGLSPGGSSPTLVQIAAYDYSQIFTAICLRN
jgi:hypothetical protein